MKKIAVINLKKISGGSSANSEQSRKTELYTDHIKIFSDELRAQILEINPNLIVCCGKGLLKECEDILFIKSDDSKYDYYFDEDENRLKNGCYIFEVYHPSCTNVNANYNNIVEQFRRIYKK